jgi:hypothetical protein
MSAAIVFGGYGTFGTLVARELARQGIAVTVAGRDRSRAEALARSLGSAHSGLAADVMRPESCRAALYRHRVAVNCAGPFGPFDATLLEACLEAGCHYVDIADDRAYAALVRDHGERFRQRGLAAVYGCSSLPGISGALALEALANASSAPERARITLFIGNNPKGRAAIRSLVRGLGKPIRAPQGIIKGFRDRELAPLPKPFGPRAVFNFDSPEYDLLPPLLGVRSVVVKVGFELSPVDNAFALLAALGADYGDGTADLLEWLGRCCRRGGTSGGAVMAELFWRDGSSRRAALCARQGGQLMAALPCALAAQALMQSSSPARGALTAYELLGPAALLDRLGAAGFERHLI